MSADLLFKTMTAIENLFAAPDAQAEQEAEEQLLAVRYEIRKHLVNITLDQMADNARELGIGLTADGKFFCDGKTCKQPAPAQLQDIEQYRLQMAAISTAALGYWKKGDDIHPDYVTPTLHDVADLYTKYDELFKRKADQPAQPLPPNCGTGYCSCIECLKGKP